MLKVKNLEKSYGNNQVLKGVDITIPANSIFGFAGINGAGKSTLIKCILNFLNQDKGEIIFKDDPSIIMPDYRRKIGYLPEVFQPPLDLKAREFIEYCYKLITDKNPSQELFEKIWRDVGLKTSAQTLIRTFSKGMRQRLGIAQAIIHNPDILILDEPFSGLDPIGRYELKKLFRNIHKSGYTIFFSSHNLNEIQDFCTHLGILHDGKVTVQGTITDILKQTEVTNLEKAYMKIINYEKKEL